MNNQRLADHRMKMLIKLAQRGASNARIHRAIRAHKKIAGEEEVATEEPERIAETDRRAI